MNVDSPINFGLKINRDEYPVIIESYNNGQTGPQIAAKYGVNVVTIYNILEKLGVTRRTGVDYRTYNVDVGFFEAWSPLMAYWLGFLCADGCICNGAININLKISDKSHLAKFCSALGTDKKSRYQEFHTPFGTTKQHRIAIYSVQLVNSLIKLGFRDFKAGNPALVDQIPRDLFSHWLRGMTDGDGTVSFNKFPQWRLVDKYPDILHSVGERLSVLTNTTTFKVYKSKTIFVICAKKRKGMKVLDFIYKNNCEALERKRIVYETIKSNY